ncbi:YegP family protein [Actinomadura roseirufa]|uniref:YegP family protein n=1 Tax=Actinomadura roseirufa TaxID=2094049 RepID=UPI0013F16D88|nr:hypothetical protein [Actinomadura roseirufa]
MRFVRYRTAEGLVYWRFLTGNHRIVAVSPRGFANPDDTTDAIRTMQAHSLDAPIDFSSDRGGMWTWAMRVDGIVVATSAHPYGRRREVDSAAQRFRVLAPTAAVDEWTAGRGEQRPARHRRRTSPAHDPTSPAMIVHAQHAVPEQTPLTRHAPPFRTHMPPHTEPTAR